MQKERIKAKVSDLVLNEGQLHWLPKNPRQWTQTDIERTKKSLETDSDFQQDKPLLVVNYGDKLLVFGGNLRTTAAKALKWGTFDAMLYTPETEEDYFTIKRRAILDNGSFGEWDMDMLANEWDDLPLKDWGVDIGEWKPLNDVKPVKEHEDLSGQMDALYQICIDCEDEAEQEQIYNELRSVYKCRVLTL